MDITDSSDSPPNRQFDMSKCLSLTRTPSRNFDTAKTDSVNDLCKYRAAPLFTGEVYHRAVAKQPSCHEILQQEVYAQFALLGSVQDEDPDSASEADVEVKPVDNLVFTNMSEPWSAFICGSQGSGKSHTLSCLLEGALMVSPDLGVLKKPLVSMVFHWDTFSSHGNGQICEAAYLSSAHVPVRVLVAPTSLERMKRQYRNLPGVPESSPKPRVFPLYLRQDQISIDILMTLMAVSETGSSVPLYISIIFNELKQMVIDDQQNPVIDWEAFVSKIPSLGLTEGQLAPLKQRLELLRTILLDKDQSAEVLKEHEEIWDPRPGTLTIVDLSDQFVNEAAACTLFSICLKLFAGGWQSGPRMIALDEAHKFLTGSSEATKLVTELVQIIRQQRHCGSRVIIATQEPTVSGELLDLCSISIVHRFNSPKWYDTIRQHLAGAHFDDENTKSLLRRIVELGTGEALVFCPTAIFELVAGRPVTLKDSYAKVSIRNRISADGGLSVSATQEAPELISDGSDDNTAPYNRIKTWGEHQASGKAQKYQKNSTSTQPGKSKAKKRQI